MDLVIFASVEYIKKMSCVHNSSYKFIQSFWNFAAIYYIVWRCACDFTKTSDYFSLLLLHVVNLVIICFNSAYIE